MNKILITGASGFIGRALAQKMSAHGYTILSLTRNASHQTDKTLYWNPDKDELPLAFLEGLEGVIHLAGESIAALRWTRKKKERIFLSRVRSSWLLSHALLRVKKAPSFFFSASAVGYYGSRGDDILTEKSSKGTGFLAEVCSKWEEASHCLTQRGVRVIHGRFGNVLDPSGGMLKRLIPLFKCGLGAQLGNGHQWMSWISRDDLISAIEWILFSSSVEGPVNCSSPNPVTQKEWAHALSKTLHRPLIWKIPKTIVQMIFGEMGEQLFLSSLRVLPEKLIESGFVFENPTLQSFFDTSALL